jgi:hypothetical protein
MSSRRVKKKKKVEDDLEIWTKFEEIPSAPAKVMIHGGYMMCVEGQMVAYEKDANEEQQVKYKFTLAESLKQAVCSGNVQFVSKVLNSKRTRECLVLTQHKPQTQFQNALSSVFQIYGVPQPIQPKFGFHDLLWGGLHRRCERCNLLNEATKSNHLPLVRELIRQRFDINAMYSDGRLTGDYIRYPLLIAIENGFRDIVDFLIEQPKIILTHPSTKVWKRSGRNSRLRCNPTCLSEAAGRGMFDVVKKLVEKGALDPLSTSRPDDPYSMIEETPSKAQELVHLSINEAIREAYRSADPNERNRSFRGNKNSEQPCSDILELLLSKTSRQEDDIIKMYFIDRIKAGDWRDIQPCSRHSYRYVLEDDKDFDLTTGAPSARALAIRRGLQTLSPNVLRAFIEISQSEEAVVVEKYNEWSELLKFCRKRLSEAGPEWRTAFHDAYHAPVRDSALIGTLRRKQQMLFWCHLFACPWSREIHSHYPSSTKLYVKELMRIGSLLDRKHGQVGALRDMWQKEIITFVID